MNESLIIVAVLTVIIIVLLIKTAIVVPQRSEYIVQRLGKYDKSLSAGFHILFPFLDKVAYKRSLKEEVDRKSTRLNSSHIPLSRMPSSA